MAGGGSIFGRGGCAGAGCGQTRGLRFALPAGEWRGMKKGREKRAAANGGLSTALDKSGKGPAKDKFFAG